ncbi:MAG: hypothetical protein ACXQS8_00260 [Candidatus Helarchaeales archaeon]
MGLSEFIKNLLSKESSLETAREFETEFDKLRNSINASAIMIAGINGSYKGLSIISSCNDEINERALAANLPDLVNFTSKAYMSIFNREFLEFTVNVDDDIIYVKKISPALVLVASLKGSSGLKRLQNWISKKFVKIMKLFNI